MNYHILTLFPEMVLDVLNTSIIGRAAGKGLLSIEAVNIRITRKKSTATWMIPHMAAEQAW